MANSELTAAQKQVLEKLPESIDVERLDRLWIFDPQVGNSRETGLFVASLHAESRMGAEMRELNTIRYTMESTGTKPRLDSQVLPEGWAPPDRIDRVIAGVLARIGDTAPDPRDEVFDPEESWEAFLGRLDPSG